MPPHVLLPLAVLADGSSAAGARDAVRPRQGEGTHASGLADHLFRSRVRPYQPIAHTIVTHCLRHFVDV